MSKKSINSVIEFFGQVKSIDIKTLCIKLFNYKQSVIKIQSNKRYKIGTFVRIFYTEGIRNRQKYSYCKINKVEGIKKIFSIKEIKKINDMIMVSFINNDIEFQKEFAEYDIFLKKILEENCTHTILFDNSNVVYDFEYYSLI